VYAIRNETDLLVLKNLIKNSIENNETTKNCPRFEVKLSGDLGFSELQDAFYNLGSFSESLGVPVKDISKQLGKTYIKGCDKLFAEALSIFWPFFTEKLLPHYNVVRFHDMFINFSNPNNTCFDKLSNQTKNSLSNIFIDEFQDISPEVSNWIKATLRRLKGEQLNTSLMCVGDDYQSIYGWRGSSPEFINNYQKYFPSKNINSIEMSFNYRSYQLIVSAAESALAYNRSIVKTGICKSDDNEERLILNDYPERELINRIKEELTPLISKLSQQEWSKNEKGLLILAKTNDMLSKIKQILNLKILPDWIQFETFHRSKGLEADYCFLVEDCSYDSNNVLRNYLYRLAEFSLSYDDAQKEEAMRLAYVGLTRAKLRLWWFVKENPTGSFVNVKNFISSKENKK
jgi:superfamily I DNA/RNA helicase